MDWSRWMEIRNGENVYFIKMLSLRIKKKRNDENTVILSFVDFGTRVEERSRILLFVRLVPFPPARGKYFILDKKESGYFTAVFDKVNTFLPFFAFDWWIVSLKKIRYPNLHFFETAHILNGKCFWFDLERRRKEKEFESLHRILILQNWTKRIEQPPINNHLQDSPSYSTPYLKRRRRRACTCRALGRLLVPSWTRRSLLSKRRDGS